MSRDITGMSDTLETVSVLRSAKNLFFAVSLICLLGLGTIFVFSRIGMINCPWDASIDNDTASCSAIDMPDKDIEVPALSAVVGNESQVAEPEVSDDVAEKVEADIQAEPEVIQGQVAEAVASTIDAEPVVEPQAEVTQEQPVTEQGEMSDAELKITPAKWKLSWRAASSLIRLCNTVLVFSLTLYCFTLLICVKLTLVGRLGAAYYITSAMFLSMFAAVFFMPWQAAFPGVGLAGAMYLPYELACATINFSELSKLGVLMFYVRYGGLWLVVLLSLIMAQGRSMCWAAKCMSNASDA